MAKNLNKPTENFEGKSEIQKNVLSEKNVEFEWEKVKFPEVELANIDEAINYLNAQRDLLMKKHREKNENIINEVDDMLKKCVDKWLKKEYWCSDWDIKHYYTDVIDFLRSYNWELAPLMKSIIDKFREICSQYCGWGSFCEEISHRAGVPINRMKDLSDDQILQIVKNDIDNIDKLNKATCCNWANEDLWVASVYLWVIKNVVDEYEKNYNPAKYL